MRTMISGVLILILWGGVPALAQLPPEIQADFHLLRAEQAIGESDTARAMVELDKIILLQKEHELDLPEEFHFRYAQVAAAADLPEQALEAVVRYLTAAGREGRHYEEALQLLNQVHDAIEASKEPQEASNEPSPPSSDANSGEGTPGQADFSITATTAQTLPPGLDAQVEVMWKVLPEEVVLDSFGTRVAKRYYGVEVVIGNNSGFDLQLAAVGFRNYKSLPAGSAECPTDREYPSMPVDSYQIVRGSLERAREVGFRHKLLSGFKVAGLLMTGFLPFYEAPSRAKTHYTGLTNIVSGPVISGLEAIIPDTTINQLRQLDIQALRDGIIIPNNTHRRTMTFISKRALVCGTGKPSNNPLQVTSALGDLVLIGTQVQYLQRVQVVSNGSGAVMPPPVVIALTGTEKKISRGLPGATELTLKGSSLNNATVEVPADVEGIKITEQTVNNAGDEIKIKLTVTTEVDPGPYRLKVTTPNGSTDVGIQVVQ